MRGRRCGPTPSIAAGLARATRPVVLASAGLPFLRAGAPALSPPHPPRGPPRDGDRGEGDHPKCLLSADLRRISDTHSNVDAAQLARTCQPRDRAAIESHDSSELVAGPGRLDRRVAAVPLEEDPRGGGRPRRRRRRVLLLQRCGGHQGSGGRARVLSGAAERGLREHPVGDDRPPQGRGSIPRHAGRQPGGTGPRPGLVRPREVRGGGRRGRARGGQDRRGARVEARDDRGGAGGAAEVCRRRRAVPGGGEGQPARR
ncbi:MAG: hypothetical protein AVDCRST_MAG11-3897 [uncultured Gemmatimonadaceae bacterium]|uniref:Uncharacterized protein n=1 Tax=uncultured Gemmatimonadaceae bacterium TaxID=246130 RepID=A0A6J4MDS0_9BACT|nr:MAG: hypothetical protein AVDCRST_MAG11-3897 [uncultured Gemmatimonadaceae bacterium]